MVLPFSSGASGQAKAVELTHRSLLATGSVVCQVFDLWPGDRVLAVVPLAHVMRIGVSLPAAFLSEPAWWPAAVHPRRGPAPVEMAATPVVSVSRAPGDAVAETAADRPH